MIETVNIYTCDECKRTEKIKEGEESNFINIDTLKLIMPSGAVKEINNLDVCCESCYLEGVTRIIGIKLNRQSAPTNVNREQVISRERQEEMNLEMNREMNRKLNQEIPPPPMDRQAPPPMNRPPNNKNSFMEKVDEPKNNKPEKKKSFLSNPFSRG